MSTLRTREEFEKEWGEHILWIPPFIAAFLTIGLIWLASSGATAKEEALDSHHWQQAKIQNTNEYNQVWQVIVGNEPPPTKAVERFVNAINPILDGGSPEPDPLSIRRSTDSLFTLQFEPYLVRQLPYYWKEGFESFSILDNSFYRLKHGVIDELLLVHETGSTASVLRVFEPETNYLEDTPGLWKSTYFSWFLTRVYLGATWLLVILRKPVIWRLYTIYNRFAPWQHPVPKPTQEEELLELFTTMKQRVLGLDLLPSEKQPLLDAIDRSVAQLVAVQRNNDRMGAKAELEIIDQTLEPLHQQVADSASARMAALAEVP